MKDYRFRYECSPQRDSVVGVIPCAWHEQVLEIWKMLLDPESMNGALEKNRFLELFYDDCIGKLSDALTPESAAPNVSAHSPLSSCQHLPQSRGAGASACGTTDRQLPSLRAPSPSPTP